MKRSSHLLFRDSLDYFHRPRAHTHGLALRASSWALTPCGTILERALALLYSIFNNINKSNEHEVHFNYVLVSLFSRGEFVGWRCLFARRAVLRWFIT